MKRFIALIVVWCLVALAAPLLAAGITANFGEIVVQELRIGYPFSLKDRAHLPYIITNASKKPIDINIEVRSPLPKDVKDGYEPIPDTSWIKMEKPFFTLNISEQVSTDITFNIPKDEKIIGKKYQVNLYPYTTEGMVRIELKSIILFTISKETGPYVEFLGGKEFKEAASFDLDPIEFNLEEIVVGEKIDLAKVIGKSLKITNTSDQECNFYMNTKAFKGFNAVIKPGYIDTPDPNILSFDSELITIKPKESATVKLFIQFPKDNKYKGKKYAFLIPIVLGEQEVPFVRYAYLYVTTKK